MQEKDKPKKKGTLSPLMPRSPVRNYQAPLLHKIATKIVVDDMQFLPKYQENSAYVDLMTNGDVWLSEGETATVDCGFSMEIPAAYKVIVEAKMFRVVKWESSDRFKVTIYNPGLMDHKILHGSVFAQMHIEPVYRFDWNLFDRSKNG